MPRVNGRLITPRDWSAILWPGAVGANTSLVNANDECARLVTVRTVAAGCTLVLRDIGGNDITFDFTDLTNQNFYIRGQWQLLVAAGSANAWDIRAAW